jgi:hypothetical protein
LNAFLATCGGQRPGEDRAAQEGAEPPRNAFEEIHNAKDFPYWRSSENAPRSSDLYPPEPRGREHGLNAGKAGAYFGTEAAVSGGLWWMAKNERDAAYEEMKKNPNEFTIARWQRAQDPSANSPCTKTTFFVFTDVWALTTRLSRGKAATAAAAPINVRRFIIASN